MTDTDVRVYKCSACGEVTKPPERCSVCGFSGVRFEICSTCHKTVNPACSDGFHYIAVATKADLIKAVATALAKSNGCDLDDPRVGQMTISSFVRDAKAAIAAYEANAQ